MTTKLTAKQIEKLGYTVADITAAVGYYPTMLERLTWAVKMVFRSRPQFMPNFVVDGRGTAFRPL